MRRSRFLLGLGCLSLINVVFLLFTTNVHLGHFLQLAVSFGILLWGALFRKLPRWVNGVLGALSLIPVSIMIFLAVFGNSRTANFSEEVVIVLGAGLLDSEVQNPLARRLDTAIQYFSDKYIVVSGGYGAGQRVSEAQAMRDYLVARGIPDSRVILENASTSTWENLVFSEEIIQERFGDVGIVLISNDFHLYRATTFAEELGMEVTHFGAPTPWESLVLNYLRETVAVLDMWVHTFFR